MPLNLAAKIAKPPKEPPGEGQPAFSLSARCHNNVCQQLVVSSPDRPKDYCYVPDLTQDLVIPGKVLKALVVVCKVGVDALDAIYGTLFAFAAQAEKVPIVEEEHPLKVFGDEAPRGSEVEGT
jgi:hypothetical protein